MAKFVIVNDYFVLLVGLLVIRFIFICIELSVKGSYQEFILFVFWSFPEKKHYHTRAEIINKFTELKNVEHTFDNIAFNIKHLGAISLLYKATSIKNI